MKDIMKDNNLLVISCIFGNKFTKVYDAPLKQNCYFFTNNCLIKNEIINKGWNYKFVNFELSCDSIVSSLQSKYIKFLIFLKDYNEFNSFKNIIYFDHKFNVLKEHIDVLKYIYTTSNSNIIIRETPKIKLTIMDEVNDANCQERYKKNMPKTIQFINNKIKQLKISNNVRICNTGIIFYNNYEKIMPMLNKIYDACITLEQPECQIFWGVFSQKYEKYIKTIKFEELNPLWKCPNT
jgi:hypothetical protein